MDAGQRRNDPLEAVRSGASGENFLARASAAEPVRKTADTRLPLVELNKGQENKGARGGGRGGRYLH